MKDFANLRIAVAGTGYVGLSIATLLAQHHKVIAVDVVPEKVELINNKKSPIQDEYIEKYLLEKELNLTATLDGRSAYKEADFVVIAAPTNYDPQKNFFDTHHIEDVIDLVLEVNPDAAMVIKSTIPVGYCRSLYVKYAPMFQYKPELKGKKFNLLFSPEFLRESKALYDNLYPSRIIVGYPKMIDLEGRVSAEENAAVRAIGNPEAEELARIFARLLHEGALKENIDTLFMGMKEAEAVKLFANTYLALRVSYFNELDTYAEVYKYQSSAEIVREVMACYGEEKTVFPMQNPALKRKTELFGVYSPLGRCLKTSFAWTLGQILSEERSVLLISLEEYSGLEELMQKKFSCTLSDLLYYVRQKNPGVILKLNSMVQSVGQLDFVPPVLFSAEENSKFSNSP